MIRLTAILFIFCQFARAEVVTDITPLTKVGRLTHVSSSRYIDLSKVKKVEGQIVCNLARAARVFPLTEQGVKEALAFAKSGKMPSGTSQFGGVLAVINLDDVALQPFHATADTDELEPGLKKAREFFAELMKLFQ